MPVSLQGPGRRSGSWIETESQLDEWGQLWCLMGYLDDLGAKKKSWEALAGCRQHSALGHGAVCAQTQQLYNVFAEVWVLQPLSNMGRAVPGSHGQSWLSVPCSLTWHRLAQTSCPYSAFQQALIKPQDCSELLIFVFGGRKKETIPQWLFGKTASFQAIQVTMPSIP